MIDPGFTPGASAGRDDAPKPPPPSFAAGRLHPDTLDALSGAAGLLAGHGHRDSSSAVLAARRALTPAKHIRSASPVTPEQIDYAFEKAGANYGGANHAELLASSLLKIAAGYYCSHVITVIMADLGLISKRGVLTAAGKRYLGYAFSDVMSHGG